MKPDHHPLRACWRIVAPVIVLLLLYPAHALADEHPDPLGQLTAEGQTVAQAVNQRRAEAGLHPLALHPLLTLAAQNHVNDIVGGGAYGHVGSDGSNVRQRVQRIGYSSGGWASENWVNATSPEGAMTWWMNDWIHRVNILNPRWQEFGVGVGVLPSGRTIYVTVFTAGDGVEGGMTPEVAVANVRQVASGTIDYTIQPGDTLIAIAARYGIDWTSIATENRLREDTLLQIGQVLRLPGVENVGGPAVAEKTTAASGFAGNEGGGAYQVKAGDTLLGIALRHNLTWQTLAAANGLGEHDLLQIGQQLKIPGQATPAGAQPAPSQPTGFIPAAAPSPLTASQTYYTVQPGDTILGIAIRHGLDWQTLLTLNGFSEETLLQIGQQIRLR